MTNDGTLSITGGTIDISDNTNFDLMSSNIRYDNTESPCPIKVTGSLAPETKIGLNPTDTSFGTILVTSTNASYIDANQFSVDTSEAKIEVSDKNLICGIGTRGPFGGYVFFDDANLYEISEELSGEFTWSQAMTITTMGRQ